jgi:hypothetical protein
LIGFVRFEASLGETPASALRDTVSPFTGRLPVVYRRDY